MQSIKCGLVIGVLGAALGGFVGLQLTARAQPPPRTERLGVGPQYDATHVYVGPNDFNRFVASVMATFGGKSTPQTLTTITPTPSKAMWRAIVTPVGLISALGFVAPTPYPFGAERTGYLVTDIDAAVRTARADGAAIVVAPFNDPIGRDVIVQWPGGVYMQFYSHTISLHNAPLATVPENRVYVSPDVANEFTRDFVAFAHGRVVSDDPNAPGIEIGKPNATYRRIRIDSIFGKMTVLATDGQLPYPYGRETTGYDVANLAETLAKARNSGVTILVAPYRSDGRESAIVQFPGGYIAEIHSAMSALQR